MAARRPIIAIGSLDGAIQPISKQTNAGVYFSYQEHEAIYTHLEQQYLAYLRNELKVKSHDVEAYSREAISKKMAEILLQV